MNLCLSVLDAFYVLIGHLETQKYRTPSLIGSDGAFEPPKTKKSMLKLFCFWAWFLALQTNTHIARHECLHKLLVLNLKKGPYDIVLFFISTLWFCLYLLDAPSLLFWLWTFCQLLLKFKYRLAFGCANSLVEFWSDLDLNSIKKKNIRI